MLPGTDLKMPGILPSLVNNAMVPRKFLLISNRPISAHIASCKMIPHHYTKERLRISTIRTVAQRMHSWYREGTSSYGANGSPSRVCNETTRKKEYSWTEVNLSLGDPLSSGATVSSWMLDNSRCSGESVPTLVGMSEASRTRRYMGKQNLLQISTIIFSE